MDLGLRPPAHRVSRRAPTYWTLRALPRWLVICAVVGAVLFSNDVSGLTRVLVIVVVLLLAATHVIVMPRWRYRVHRWEITETAVYTQSGWFSQERRLAPIARVQTVDTERGPIEQLLGLSYVTLTPASAKGPIKIHALDRSVADETVAWLTERAQAAGGDGT